jgi:hypothetical protein
VRTKNICLVARIATTDPSATVTYYIGIANTLSARMLFQTTMSSNTRSLAVNYIQKKLVVQNVTVDKTVNVVFR